MADDPIPVFDPGSVKAAIEMNKRTGKLRRLPKTPKAVPSLRPAVEQFAALNRRINRLVGLVARLVVPRLKAMIDDAPTELRGAARFDVGQLLEDTMEELREAFEEEGEAEGIARRAAENTNRRRSRDHQRQVSRVLGIRPDFSEPWLDDVLGEFVRKNSESVTGVTDDFMEQLQDRISSGIRQGLTAVELQAEVERDFVRAFRGGGVGRPKTSEIARARARSKLIVRDQLLKLSGDLDRIRQGELGVERYVWRTVGDSKVRGTGKPRRHPGSHVSRDGEIFEHGRPIRAQLSEKRLVPAKIDGPPGVPINCRCWAEPVLEDLVA